MINPNFDLNADLVSKHEPHFNKAFSDHVLYADEAENVFGYNKEIKTMSPDNRTVSLIMYSVVCELTGEVGVPFGEYMNRLILLRAEDDHGVLLKKLKSVDYRVFPNSYIIDTNKDREIDEAIKIIESSINDEGWFGDLSNHTGSFGDFYNFFIAKAVDINNKLNSLGFFGTIPEDTVALGLMCRRMMIISNVPMYCIGGQEDAGMKVVKQNLLNILERVFEETYL
jgi:hypothetical protein